MTHNIGDVKVGMLVKRIAYFTETIRRIEKEYPYYGLVLRVKRATWETGADMCLVMFPDRDENLEDYKLEIIHVDRI